jgi:hypothetical protein
VEAHTERLREFVRDVAGPKLFLIPSKEVENVGDSGSVKGFREFCAIDFLPHGNLGNDEIEVHTPGISPPPRSSL